MIQAVNKMLAGFVPWQVGWIGVESLSFFLSYCCFGLCAYCVVYIAYAPKPIACTYMLIETTIRVSVKMNGLS